MRTRPGYVHGMTVYLLIHDDRDCDMGDTYVRAIYATSEAAQADLKAKRTRDTEGHGHGCCKVEDWVVIDRAMEGMG